MVNAGASDTLGKLFPPRSMSALQRLLGRDDQFYRLLEASGNQAKAGAAQLTLLLPQISGSGSKDVLNEIAMSRQKHKVLS